MDAEVMDLFERTLDPTAVHAVEAATDGAVWYDDGGSGEPWLGAEPMLWQLVHDEISLPVDVKIQFAEYMALLLGSLSAVDDDDYMMWRGRENFPKFLAMDPPIPDPRAAAAQ